MIKDLCLELAKARAWDSFMLYLSEEKESSTMDLVRGDTNVARTRGFLEAVVSLEVYGKMALQEKMYNVAQELLAESNWTPLCSKVEENAEDFYSEEELDDE